MKRTIFTAILFICLCFAYSTPIWGMSVDYHTLTLDPQSNTLCSLPTPNDTFYSYHKAVYCWFSYTGATIGNEVYVMWYKPGGTLYKIRSYKYHYVTGCTWGAPLYISKTEVQYMSGLWRVDVYYHNGDYFSENFTIINTIPTTTSTPETTTTTTEPEPPATTTTTEPTTTTTADSTTTTISCPSETIYGTDSTETELLRSIRDNVLSTTQEGQELIRLYYQWSPVIVRAMEEDEEFKQDIKKMVDEVLPLIFQ